MEYALLNLFFFSVFFSVTLAIFYHIKNRWVNSSLLKYNDFLFEPGIWNHRITKTRKNLKITESNMVLVTSVTPGETQRKWKIWHFILYLFSLHTLSWAAVEGSVMHPSNGTWNSKTGREEKKLNSPQISIWTLFSFSWIQRYKLVLMGEGTCCPCTNHSRHYS